MQVPMTELTSEIATLHTALIDARNGYREALDDAGDGDVAPVFRVMLDLNERHASDLSGILLSLGAQPDETGSFMTTVNTAIMKVRSVFGGLDGSVLPGLIDGEERNLGAYDQAIAKAADAPAVAGELTRQREALSLKIGHMKMQRDKMS